MLTHFGSEVSICSAIIIVFLLSLGDFSVDNIYQYATTATYQIDEDSPPPPAPPSPPVHAHQHPLPHSSPNNHGHMQRHGQQKAFTTVVYQPASLHDVDSPNVVSIKYFQSVLHIF